jgi:two-component system, LytTR family, sensor kinase
MKASAFLSFWNLKMKPLFNIKRFKFYVLVGLAFLMIWLLNSYLNFPGAFLSQSLNEIWRAVYIIVINYIFFELAIPVIRLKWKKIHITISIVLSMIFFYSFGLYAWRYIGIQLNIYTVLNAYDSVLSGVYVQFTGGLFSVLFFGIIKHFYDFRKLKEAEQKLRIEKQESELNYLRSQTNPHFLFNTLNNIYSLARDKSDLAAESVLRLSGILRFMLYETGGDYINMEQELKIISDYIALEKLRYDESLRVSFTYEAEDMKQPLPPLLLIPLVENAFKHGVSETLNRPFIDINLISNRQQLEFCVKNSTEKHSGERNVKENIGLSNLRRQLELLYKDYSLSVQQGESVFTAILKINLSSHV